ncbi:MAG: protein-export chaperone SecB [Muribaculaceae bacterium]|nr:protein-export chaperone SecB [Muribaculaceae bacterium]
MAQTQSAAFSFKDYKFTNVNVDFKKAEALEGLNINFSPCGVYDPESGIFSMQLVFTASDEKGDAKVIEIECHATFRFKVACRFEELPDYFFVNSTAILYPYIRAFVSTLTLLANYPPIVLPTFNVAGLGKELQQNTTVRTEPDARP